MRFLRNLVTIFPSFFSFLESWTTMKESKRFWFLVFLVIYTIITSVSCSYSEGEIFSECFTTVMGTLDKIDIN